jgi:hypothetical protein
MAGDIITSTRPVEDLAILMERRYSVPVTYEDPMWEFPGDLQAGAKFPKLPTFGAPSALTPALRPRLDAEILGEALEAYHSQTGGPRFKIATSRLGLHLIPDQVRGADGSFAAARNPLDTVVGLPVTERSRDQHIADLCAAIGTAMGARILYSPDTYSGHGDAGNSPAVAWGARGIPARQALMELLEPSAEDLHWRLNCMSGRLCFLQVEPMNLPPLVLAIGAQSIQPNLPDVPGLPLDWCTGCTRVHSLIPRLFPLPTVVK